MRTLIERIALALTARRNCELADNQVWLAEWNESLDKLDTLLPRGGGFDGGSRVNRARSTSATVIINTSYHCMDDTGCYCGWVDVKITVCSTFCEIEIDVAINGEPDDPDYDDTALAEYIVDVFHATLTGRIS